MSCDSSAFQGPPAAITLQNAPGSNPPGGLCTLTCLQTCPAANSCTARSAFLPGKGRGRAEQPMGGDKSCPLGFLVNHPWDSGYWEKTSLVLCVLFEEREPLAQLWQRLAEPVWAGWGGNSSVLVHWGEEALMVVLPVPLCWHHPWHHEGDHGFTQDQITPQPHFPGLWESFLRRILTGPASRQEGLASFPASSHMKHKTLKKSSVAAATGPLHSPFPKGSLCPQHWGALHKYLEWMNKLLKLPRRRGKHCCEQSMASLSHGVKLLRCLFTYKWSVNAWIRKSPQKKGEQFVLSIELFIKELTDRKENLSKYPPVY